MIVGDIHHVDSGVRGHESQEGPGPVEPRVHHPQGPPARRAHRQHAVDPVAVPLGQSRRDQAAHRTAPGQNALGLAETLFEFVEDLDLIGNGLGDGPPPCGVRRRGQRVAVPDQGRARSRRRTLSFSDHRGPAMTPDENGPVPLGRHLDDPVRAMFAGSADGRVPESLFSRKKSGLQDHGME